MASNKTLKLKKNEKSKVVEAALKELINELVDNIDDWCECVENALVDAGVEIPEDHDSYDVYFGEVFSEVSKKLKSLIED